MYPIWEVPYISAGLVLGLIAAFHILPSHLSTGAMWFNIYVETKAYRENKPELKEFIKKYTLLLLVFSYVLGSLSGIGIWYAATVTNPRGISGLIHNYVWGWATEWVFFLIEVIGIFIYYYTFDKVDKKTHLTIGWIFALASWTTMVIIVGILSFMLTPGKWPKTGGFFAGFFNPTYWPQLFVRTAFMFVIAAAYALACATRVKDNTVRTSITQVASLWGIGGLLLGSLLLFWFLNTLPEKSKELLAILPSVELKGGLFVSLALLILYFLFARLKPLKINVYTAVFAIIVIFGGIWSLERMREMIRNPYVIPQYMFSNQIIAHTVEAKGVQSEEKVISEKGILKVFPFIPEGTREINQRNQWEAGRLIALLQCGSCHVLDQNGLRAMPQMIGRMNIKKGKGFNDQEIAQVENLIDSLGSYPYMLPFLGTAAEKRALALYLYSLAK